MNPVNDQQTEEQLEKADLIAAVREGEQSIQKGRTKPAEEVFAELEVKPGR